MKVRPVKLTALLLASSWVAGESVVVLGHAGQHVSAWWGRVEARAHAPTESRWLPTFIRGLCMAVKS
jgi:hypothetical protein